MKEPHLELDVLEELLGRSLAGNQSAREQLLQHLGERLRYLAHIRLARFGHLQRWEQTDDVLNGALYRLHRALDEVRPATVRDLLNLTGVMIRRELIDLQRHYFGPEGHGRHHATLPPPSESQDGSPGPGGGAGRGIEPANATYEPGHLAELTEFHQRVEALPDDLREVFNLTWYQGLSQEEAARVLGVSVPTVKRRWREVRLELGQYLQGEEPQDSQG